MPNALTKITLGKEKRLINEDERVLAGAALDLLEKRFATRDAAKRHIGELLRDGKIAARSEKVFVSSQIDLNKAWKSRHHEEAEFSLDFDLDKRDWRNSRQWSADLDLWRWPENRFVLTTCLDPIEREFYEGVSFSSTEIASLAMGDDPEKNSNSNRGQKADLQRWNRMWMEVVDMANKGDLNPLKIRSKAELISRIRDAVGSEAFSERWLDPIATDIWKRFMITP